MDDLDRYSAQVQGNNGSISKCKKDNFELVSRHHDQKDENSPVLLTSCYDDESEVYLPEG